MWPIQPRSPSARFTPNSRDASNKQLPPERPPDTARKRGWTNKRVSNTKLHAAGWREKFPSWFDALDNDPALVPSILASLHPRRS